MENFYCKRKIRGDLYKNLYSSRNDIYKFTLLMNENLYLTSVDSVVIEERYREYLKMLDFEIPMAEFTIEGINRVNGIPVVTAYKVIHDPIQPMHKGILIVDLRLNKIEEIIGGLRNNSVGEAFILNTSGQYIYHPNPSFIGVVAEPSVLRELEGGNGYTTRGKGSDKMMVSYQTSEQPNWTFVFEMPMKVLTAELAQLRTMAFIIFGCIAVVALFLLGSFTFYLIRSLSFVQQLMRRAESGNLNVRAPVKSKDEIGMLYHSFNTMMDEYRRLIYVEHTSKLKEKEMQVRQKESTLIALQSQINPHFLFNTLGMIHSMASLSGNKPVSRMVANLAEIFRYSMDNDSQMISLWHEIRYIRTYFEIQNERYDELRTEIIIEKDKKLVQIPCIKLMLQPLVENALMHGYQAYGLEPDYIGVVGSFTEQGYEIRVIDKGGGMSLVVRNQFNEMFQSLTENKLIEEDQWLKSGSIGLYNVHKRLRLVYGEPYGLLIEKSDCEGTVVRILVPDAVKVVVSQ